MRCGENVVDGDGKVFNLVNIAEVPEYSDALDPGRLAASLTGTTIAVGECVNLPVPRVREIAAGKYEGYFGCLTFQRRS